MITFLIFLFVIFSFFLIMYPHVKYHIKLYITIGSILALTAGLRPAGIDFDYNSYLYAFKYGNIGNSRLEPSFYIISSTVKYFINEPLLLFLIYAVIGVYIKFKAFKKLSELYFFSALIYFGNFFLLQEMTQIRVGVSIGILLLSVIPLYERNLKKFLVLVFFASFFHYSSIIFTFIWFLNPFKIKRRFYFLLILTSHFIASIGVPIYTLIEKIPIPQIQVLFELYKHQRDHNVGGEVNIFSGLQILKIVIAMLVLIYSNKINQKNKYSILITKIYIISVITLPLFSFFPAVSYRISELFGSVEIILIPFLIYIFPKYRIGALIVCGIGAIMLYINLFYVGLLIENTKFL